MSISIKKNPFAFVFVLLMIQTAFCQNSTAKIVDSQNGLPIAFATILINNGETIISNAEGNFSISENNNKNETTLAISYIGYATQNITIENLVQQNYTIKLVAGIINLDEVNIADQKLSAYQIMANVKANLKRNYATPSKPIKNKLFMRETTNFKPLQLGIEITKSTGFSKAALEKINNEITTFTKYLFSNPLKEYTDILCDYYSSYYKKDDKYVHNIKLDVLKATKIKNENSANSMDDLALKAKKIFLVHLDTTKFYRAKSGLFGSRDTISMSREFNSRKDKNKKTQISSTKAKLNSFFAKNRLLNETEFEFIHQIDEYEYVLEKAIYTDNNEFVYVLNFKPNKSKAKFNGKLYVSETDFAVLRVDYKLQEGKKLSGLNMKFLLGIKSSENICNGTLIFKKNVSEMGYYMQYASIEKGQYIYVNRPLKFIEITNEDNDVVAFDLKLEANTFEKKEYLNIDQTEVSQATIDKFSESEFKYLIRKAYDPQIWKNYSAIEPLEEMKQFKSAD